MKSTASWIQALIAFSVGVLEKPPRETGRFPPTLVAPPKAKLEAFPSTEVAATI